MTRMPGQGAKHAFFTLKITGLSEKNPVAALDISNLGVTRLVAITPTPLKEHFSAVWNGDTVNPELRIDGWPDGTTELLVEVWGT
jgi:hypothetical protein